MDLATFGGLFFAIATLVAGAALEHVTFESMIGESAFLIVIGGSIGATVMSHSMHEIKGLGRALKLALFPVKLNYAAMIDTLVELAERARRNGVLSLQNDADSAADPLVRTGLMMVVDGTQPDTVAEILRSLSETNTKETLHSAAMMDTIGGYCPTLGVLGTVMGLITVMQNLDDPGSLGPAIAVAFLATFYGVGAANLLFLPLGAKIKTFVASRQDFEAMVITGIIAIQNGENPRSLRERLSVLAGSHAAHGRKPARGTQSESAVEQEAGAR